LDRDAYFRIFISEYIAKKKAPDKRREFSEKSAPYGGKQIALASGPSQSHIKNWGCPGSAFFFDRMRTKEYKKECKKKKINALF
jgi:hypothetical protein